MSSFICKQSSSRRYRRHSYTYVAAVKVLVHVCRLNASSILEIYLRGTSRDRSVNRAWCWSAMPIRVLHLFTSFFSAVNRTRSSRTMRIREHGAALKTQILLPRTTRGTRESPVPDLNLRHNEKRTRSEKDEGEIKDGAWEGSVLHG